MNIEPRCEFVPGDPILIRNIVTELKAQGVFDQFRKECLSDVDTKPAYQNLCHRVDGQVSTYLSKIRWGTDLSKNQLREKIRKYVNEFNYVESGITRIVDQLVNPRINTILVPKVENIVYEYLGIPRPQKDVSSDCKSPVSDVKSNHFDEKSNDSVRIKSKNDCKTDPGNIDGQKANNFDGIFRNNAKTDLLATCADDNSKQEEIIEQIHDEEATKEDTHTSLSNIESDEENLDNVDMMNENVFEPSAPLIENNRRGGEIFDDMSEEDEEDDISPPFEPLMKSDPETSAPSIESNYSLEVADSSDKDVQPLSINNLEEKSNNLEEKSNDQNAPHSSIQNNEIVSIDSVPTSEPIDIPKTPTIHYETSSSDDNDGSKAKYNSLASIPPSGSTQEHPNCETLSNQNSAVKIEEKITEENLERKEEKRDRGSSRSRHDSRDSRYRDRKHHSDRHKHDKERRRSAEKSKDNGKERREEKREKRSSEDKKHKEGSRSSSKHDKDRRDEKKSSSSSSKHHHHHRRHHSESSRDDEKKRKKSGDSGGEVRKSAKEACSNDRKAKQDRRSSDRDSNGQPPPTPSSSSSGHSHQREKHSNKSRHSSSSSLHHKSKRNDINETKNGEKLSKINNGLKNGVVKDDKIMESVRKEKKIDGAVSKRRLEQTNCEQSDRLKETVQKTSDKLMEELELKTPKIARNQLEFGKVVKLRKQLKEKMKRLREKASQEKSASHELSLNMTRVDRKFKIVEGRCLIDENGSPSLSLINDDNNNNSDENTATNEIRYMMSDDEEMPLEPGEELSEVNIEEVIGYRTNSARFTIKNEEEKTVFDEHNKENVSSNHSQSTIADGFKYFESSTSDAKEEFKKFVDRLLNESLDVHLANFSVTMAPFPKRYDSIFREQLNAVVARIKQPAVKYNSEIINDEGIMLRIKMSHGSTKSFPESQKQNLESDDEKGINTQLRNGQLTFESTDGDSNVSDSSLSTRQMESESDEKPARTSYTKRKTLGIKRKLTKRSSPKTSTKMNNISIQIGGDGLQDLTVVGQKTEKYKETNLIRSRLSTEIDISDRINENTSSSCDNTAESNFTMPSTPLKTQKPQRKVPRRAPSFSNSHYDISDLYKPRPSFLISSRRSRGLKNSENK